MAVKEPLSIDQLREIARGKLVELPGFNGDDTFPCRLRRPSLLVLAKSGKIPNALLTQANGIFNRGTRAAMQAVSDEENPEMLSDMFSLCEILCDSAMVEPTYQEVKDAGIDLTDEQMMAIFAFTQNGVKALESFRKQSGNTEPNSNMAEVALQGE